MSTSSPIDLVFRIPSLIWANRSFWIRGLSCWILGVIVFINQDHDRFDVRLKIRGPFLSHNKIILVHITEREWSLIKTASSAAYSGSEMSMVSNQYFWNEDTWAQVIKKTLSLNPKVAAVTFLFNPNYSSDSITQDQLEILNDPKIIWSSKTAADGTVLSPSFIVGRPNQTGSVELNPDSDGILRRFSSSPIPNLHLANLTAASYQSLSHQSPELGFIINFQGPADTFESLSLYELLTEPEDSTRLKGKIVIIGPQNFSSTSFQTPLGPMSEPEALANVVDNILHSRFVDPFPSSLYFLLLAALIVLSSWVIFRFNQLASFGLHIFSAVFVAAFSAWAFDNVYLHLPVVPMLVAIGSSYMLFLGFQSNLNEQRAWKLQKEHQSLLELESLKQNFVSLFSHDLKTPIAKIHATIDRILRTHPADKGLHNDLSVLKQSGVELNRYIQSILHLSRVEASDFKINYSPSDINSIVEEVAADLGTLVEDKGISISLNLEPMFSAEFDPVLIKEVIQNLIENAVKYTPPGGFVEVSTFEEEDNAIHFEVRDTGPGISEEDLKNVWRKFYRGDDDSGGQNKGSGLGLYLVKFFIELHGGSVFMESELGAGTKVGFRIPVEPYRT